MSTAAPGVAAAPARSTRSTHGTSSDSTSLPPTVSEADVPASAIVYCEANFGSVDGKTANGLVRHSERYRILSVVDSERAGGDAGQILDGVPNAIPVLGSVADAVAHAGSVPDWFIYGMAPASGRLSIAERRVLLDAMALGMGIVNGLHEFLGEDPEFVAASIAFDVTLLDVRKPRAKLDMRTFSGRVDAVDCPRIAVLGTDCAIGKRTTATVIARALENFGLRTVMIGTGQTGLIQGARYGIALDAVPSQFCAGELEATIVEAFERERPDLILIEGQGALSHPAYATSAFILRGSRPQAVILQHAPGRRHRCDFEHMPMPEPATERHLIQTFADTRVIGLTLNHEHMSDAEIDAAVVRYERELGIPVADALIHPPERLVEMILAAFPALRDAPARRAA